MRKKIKNAARLIVVFMILATCTKCQKDDDLGQVNDNPLLSAKQWFKNYETEGSNFELFQNLDYDWNNAEITNSEDGTKTIIVPINEIKKDPTETWEQKLYIYKLGENNYEALLFEIYPDSKNIDPESSLIDSGIFTGYMAAWDLKKGFVKAAMFENGKVVQNGSIKVYSKNKGITGKAPSNQANCPAGVECDTDGSGDTDGTQLKEVVVNNNYQNPSGYIITYNNNGGGGYTGDTSPGGYTNHGTGTSGGTENTQNTNTATPNPCDKIRTQITNADFKAKQDELKKKTKEKKETGYSQSKSGTFKTLANIGSDSMNLASDANTIGYMHTHLDSYDSGLVDEDGNPIINNPIKIFSPDDIQQFLLLLINANKNKIPLSDIYGTMISSDGIYTLRFEGTYNDINLGLNFKGLDAKYLKIMRGGDKEVNFLKFLNQFIKINGISLYKINDDDTTDKKTLDTNKKIINTPC